MKKSAIIYLFGTLLIMTSCNFLDTEVYDYLEEDELYQTEKDCMAGLAGV